MTNFLQAMRWLKEGRKVTRKSWNIGNPNDEGSQSNTLGFKEGRTESGFYDATGDEFQEVFNFDSFEATDWELSEEDKTKEKICDTLTDKTAMAEVMDNMIKNIEEAKQEDPTYKDLFKKSTDFGGLLRETKNMMTTPILDTCQILRDKFDIKNTSNEIYMFLLSLPLLEYIIEERITKTEGSSCCVDKTYYLLSQILKEKIGEQA